MKIFNREISSRELVSRIILVISSIVFVYSLYMIVDYYLDSFENAAIYEDMNKQVMVAQQHNQKVFYDDTFDSLLRRVVLNEEVTSENKPDKKKMLPKLLPIYEQNKDTVGWIRVPGLDREYPVVQAKDNDHYLDTAFDGSTNRAGSIFMDYRNNADGTDRHTIVYGHNMRNGSMFGLLKKYKNLDHFEKGRIIQLDTLYEEQKWEIFSAYVTGIEFNYIKTSFKTPGEYESFINVLKDKNMHKGSTKIDVKITQEDQILTLSTCTNEYDDARFVIHAKRIGSTEKKDTELIEAETSTNDNQENTNQDNEDDNED